MAGIMRIRRTHGILGGVLVALLGIWGALIPFVGPYFHYAYTPDKAWTYDHGRLLLEIVPGSVAFVGGVLLIYAFSRHVALLGAFLGIIAGAWFALGNVLAPLWTTTWNAGVPASTTTLMRTMEQIGFFTGLGVVLVLISAAVAGRVTAVPRLVTEAPVVPAQPDSVGRRDRGRRRQHPGHQVTRRSSGNRRARAASFVPAVPPTRVAARWTWRGRATIIEAWHLPSERARTPGAA